MEMTDKLQEAIETLEIMYDQLYAAVLRKAEWYCIDANNDNMKAAISSLKEAATEAAALRERAFLAEENLKYANSIIDQERKSNRAVEKILGMTDEQIKALTILEGECPNCVANRTAQTISQALIESYKKEFTTLRAVAQQMSGALEWADDCFYSMDDGGSEDIQKGMKAVKEALTAWQKMNTTTKGEKL